VPLGDLIEVTVKEVARFLLESVVKLIFYWPGWLFLRIVTVGRYPPARESPHNEDFVAIAGLAAFIAAVTIYFSHVR
jgi:hypothetical protein